MIYTPDEVGDIDDVEPPRRVTFAEIKGDAVDTVDVCPACGTVPACDPTACPGPDQEPLL